VAAEQRVLVLDAHTNQALACVRSLGRAGYHVLVASHRSHPLAGWSRFARAGFTVGGETVAAYSELRRWAERQGVHTVLPVTERSCRLLNMERAAWERAGVIVGCAPDSTLLRAFDKARTVAIAEQCGIRIPPTVLPGTLGEARRAGQAVGFPCVVKSRFSNAWNGRRFLPDAGTAYVASLRELELAVVRHRQGEHWPLVQGYVPGTGAGVSVLANQGNPVLRFAHERMRDVRPSGSGSSLRRSSSLLPRLRDAADRLIRAMEWHGPAMVEFRDDGVTEPCLMEVNGRFWGSLELAVAAGADFPRHWTALLNGAPVEPMEGYAEGVIVRWLWGDVKRFCYIMAGPPAGFPGRFPSRWQGLRELLWRQPRGTRLETWSRDDPWPAMGEWVQGLGELVGTAIRRGDSARSSARLVQDPSAA
jgi:predicted ATP-grasp superfamily ATP-dependent carboligase